MKKKNQPPLREVTDVTDDIDPDLEDEFDDEFDDDYGDPFDLMERAGDFCARSILLTVAESKRLIAKGIAADPRVRLAMREGWVAVCKGTTNAYVVEELLGHDIEKGKYVLGNVVPSKNPEAKKAFKGSIPEVVFHDGEPVMGMTVAEAVQEMTEGDVVLKGANAIDYSQGLAGLLIGHPAGGTMGSILGAVYGRGLELIVPVGLEKQVATGLSPDPFVRPVWMTQNDIPRLWVFPAQLFTEIEAIATVSGLAKIAVQQIAAGGVCGAEGAVWLMLTGFEEDVDQVMRVVEQVQGEPSFWDSVMRKKG
ncbi:MAG: hypothetical protein HPY44_14445 [Armatimonadetes bacterium]|nr:hypothetical protein [Armatimonadota bacterium]